MANIETQQLEKKTSCGKNAATSETNNWLLEVLVHDDPVKVFSLTWIQSGSLLCASPDSELVSFIGIHLSAINIFFCY